MDSDLLKLKNDYLLIISCSKRKRVFSNAEPAVNVYDGPVYRSLRKRLDWCINKIPVDIYIISAKYGLITNQTMIENYDLEMTIERAYELRNDVSMKLTTLINSGNLKEIFINLGSVYRVTIDRIEKYVPSGTQLTFASGGIGQKTSQTISWLERVAFAGLNSEQIR